MLTRNDQRSDEAAAPTPTIPPLLVSASTVGIFLLLCGAMLWVARPVLLPTVTAVVVGTMLGPLAEAARRRGVPQSITAACLIVLVLALFNGVIVLVSAPVMDWVDKLPEIGVSIRDKLHVFDRPLALLQELRRTILPEGSESAALRIDVMSVVQPALTTLTPAAGQLLVFFGTLYFVLLGRAEMRQALVRFFSARAARLRTLRILNDVESNLTRYLATVSAINLALGAVAAIGYLLIGLPNALAWGVLAFVLNYVPYIGPLIMEAILLGVGLIAFPTLGHALMAPLFHLGLSTLEGHVVTPAIVGRRLTMNPLLVFLSLVFWTWMWGPVGAFLAVPLLIVGQMVATHSGAGRNVALPG